MGCILNESVKCQSVKRNRSAAVETLRPMLKTRSASFCYSLVGLSPLTYRASYSRVVKGDYLFRPWCDLGTNQLSITSFESLNLPLARRERLPSRSLVPETN